MFPWQQSGDEADEVRASDGMGVSEVRGVRCFFGRVGVGMGEDYLVGWIEGHPSLSLEEKKNTSEVLSFHTAIN